MGDKFLFNVSCKNLANGFEYLDLKVIATSSVSVLEYFENMNGTVKLLNCHRESKIRYVGGLQPIIDQNDSVFSVIYQGNDYVIVGKTIGDALSKSGIDQKSAISHITNHGNVVCGLTDVDFYIDEYQNRQLVVLFIKE